MPHKPYNQDELALDNQQGERPTIQPRRPPKRKAARRLKKARTVPPRSSKGDRPLRQVPSMARLTRLILAALRVWELKRGIRESPWMDFDEVELLQPIDDF